MKVEEEIPCLRVYAEELFEMPRFQAWLNEWAGKGLATWHVSENEPDDFSDVFILYDNGEGPESPITGNEGAMPQECWDLITGVCKKARIQHALLWLINIPED